MAARPQRIVIVDGYSTGRELVRELVDPQRRVLPPCSRSRKCRPMPAMASTLPPMHRTSATPAMPPRPVAMLAALRPDAVVAGSEWGVVYAESVAHGLGLATNRAEMLGARRDKFEMIEAVRRHGLRAAEQAAVATAAEAHGWADRHGRWPIVGQAARQRGRRRRRHLP